MGIAGLETRTPGLSPRVLLLDGDAGARLRLSRSLRAAGFATIDLAETTSALELMPAWLPDILLLDSQLPDADAFGVISDLKRDPRTHDIPVILLAARTREADRIAGLQSGADDFLGKTCSPSELVARVRAMLRRTHPPVEVIMAGRLRLDTRMHCVTAGNENVALRPAEFRLLRFLMANPDTVHSRVELLHHVWPSKTGMEARTVDVHVRRLRQALKPSLCDTLIQTVRSVGYRFSTRFS